MSLQLNLITIQKTNYFNLIVYSIVNNLMNPTELDVNKILGTMIDVLEPPVTQTQNDGNVVIGKEKLASG